MSVVDESDEVVLGQQAVGGVTIDDVNGTGGQCLILHGRRERPDFPGMKTIHSGQPNQSIRSAYEISSQSRNKMLTFATQIGQGSQIVALRSLPRDGNRISVLKPKRRQPAHLKASSKLPRDVSKH